MKKLFIKVSLFMWIITSILSVTFVNVAFAQRDKNFTFSAAASSVWVLNKSTGKIIFLKFEKKDKIWKSFSVNVPLSVNVDKCQIQSFARRGLCLFLFDLSSGMATVYKVKSDHSIEKCNSLSFGQSDKGFLFSGKGDNFWILNKSTREMRFIHFKSEKKVKESSPLYVPASYNLDTSQKKSVGKHGEAVFLFDMSSGMTTFHVVKLKTNEADKLEYSIERYIDANTASDLK